MNSPATGKEMKKINKFDVIIEYCEDTGGVWLDKGELEKIISIVKQESLTQNNAPNLDDFDKVNQNISNDNYRRDDDDDYYYDPKTNQRVRRKRSMLENIFEIFD